MKDFGNLSRLFGRCRRFTWIDGLILTASTIPCFYAWNLSYREIDQAREYFEEDRSPHPVYLYPAFMSVGRSFVAAPVVAWTLALLICRFRSPRPSLARLFRQPGTLACLAAVLVMSFNLLWATMRYYPDCADLRPWDIPVEVSFRSGFAVAAVWCLFGFGGRLRHEPGWIDRIGIALGIFWILDMLFGFVVSMAYARFE